MRFTASLLVAGTLLGAVVVSAPAQPDRCYQKLLYQICVSDDGQFRTEPVPALPIPGLPPPAPPATSP